MWRRLAYLLTTAPVAGLAGLGLLPILAPWLVLWQQARSGVAETRWTLVLAALGIVLFAGAPLVAFPVAALERWRYALLTGAPIAAPAGLAGLSLFRWWPARCNILVKLDLPPDDDSNRRVLAVLAYLRA